ncbi:MAG: hypothetical protein VB080_06520 [Propionicimonas sp.]|uniref:hypothetical protein n=1 Tax=Propionicimonas sp. TaxID=1955623 RepID=UPI002B2090B2|nr:hypothetical protein [Propionicimonas sp.]MEA4944078.1 hypothetical protein [Propionicimonas sp.]
MAYRWKASPEPPDAEAADLGLDQDFPDQSAAEQWLTGFFAELALAGVLEVSLYEADRLVYGPMSLEP